MRLDSVSIKNFMPYRGEQVVRFPVSKANVVVIYGDNMRGKTSFLNAVRYAFFGHATARHLRSIPKRDLVNLDAAASNDWAVSVAVDFTFDGSKFELRREFERAPLVVNPHGDEDFVERFYVRRDGVPLAGSDIKLQMNQILPEGISRFFLFDGELLQEYEILVRNPDGASRIRDSIEDILGVPALVNGRDEVRTLLNDAQTRQAEDLRHSKTLRAQAEQQIDLQKKQSTFREQIKELEASKRTADDRIEEIDRLLLEMEHIRDLMAEERALETELKGVVELQSERLARRAEVLQDAWRDLLQPRLDSIRSDLESDRAAILEEMTQAATLRFRASEYRESLSDGKCALCGLSVEDTAASHIADHLRQTEERLRTLGTAAESLGEISSRIRMLSRVQGRGSADRVLSMESELRQGALRRTQVSQRLAQVRDRLAGDHGKKVERLRAERDQLIQISGSLGREIGTKTAELLVVTRKLDQLSKLLSRNPETRMQRTSRLVATYSGLERVFSAGVDELREKQRRRVEDYASAAFKDLTSEKDFKGLLINEAYGLTIIDENGNPVPERSAGAEQIVALSLIDGLNKAGRRGGPIVMDTPFGRLDWVHRRNVLRYLPQMAEQVVLLVHEGEMDRDRDLPTLGSNISAIYKINRISARQSEIILEEERVLS